MQCEICGRLNPAQARFCMGCGQMLVKGRVCPACHTLLPAEADYCFHCGSFVAQSGASLPPAAGLAGSASVQVPPQFGAGSSAQLMPDLAPAAELALKEALRTEQNLPADIVTPAGFAPLPDLLPALQRYLPAELYEPLERHPKERDLEAVRDHLAALLRTAKTYLPAPVIENPQPAGVPAGGMYRGVFIFGDVSGFTPLSEKLKKLGQVGAEQITRLINALFTDLVGVLFEHGGTLLKFGGDALLGLFAAETDEEMALGALRAAQAAQAMQEIMKKDAFAQIDALGEKQALQIKCGISAGAYFAAHLGLEPTATDPNGSMAFVTTGETVNLAEEAEGHAHPGEVALTNAAVALAGGVLQVAAVTREPDDGYKKLVEVPRMAAEARIRPQVLEMPAGEVQTQIGWLVQRLDLLTPYLSDELVVRITTNPRDARIVPEHRPVTVMFANYKGMSRLIEKHGTNDPELITHHLNNYFVHMAAIVERYEGTLARMDQYAVGDRLVIFFGAPRAHEDDPVRAVYTALEMQQAVRQNFSALRTSTGVYRFEQRIGINTGHLFAGNAGAADLRQEYTLMGDDINMAARLMSNAPWGEIFISRRTRDHVQAYFELQDRGELKVKGKEIRIPTYSVTGRKGEVGQTRGLGSVEAPLIGRDAEMEKLQERGQMFLRGRGQILALVGNSGLGKSRLSRVLKREMQAALDRRELGWIEGKALSFSEQMSYWVAGQMLRGLLNLGPEAVQDDVLYALSVRGEELLGEDQMSAVPYLAHLLNLELGEEWAWVLKEDPKVRQKQTFWAAAAFIRAAARQRPILFALDDLHWADEASLALIEHLFQVTDQAPVMFLLMFRPQREKRCWKLRDRAASDYPHRYEEILLDALTPDESVSLLSTLLPGAVYQPHVQAEILEKAAGNPYYLEEVVRTLMEAGAVVENTQAAGQWVVTDKISQIAVPPTLHAAIIARIDRLTEDARQALQTASVIGRQFRLNLFRNVTDATAEIDIWMAQLERGGLIRPMEVSLDPEYAFPDALVQEVAYESLLVQSRQQLHRRLGEALEAAFVESLDQGAELLAFHFSHSDNDAKAQRYLEMAAKKARRDYAIETALQHYSALLEIWRRRSDAEAQQAQAGTLYQMGVIAYEMGDYDRAQPWLEQAVAAYRSLGDARNEGWSVMYMGMVDLKRANYAQAARQHNYALEHARQRGDRAQEGIHLTNLARVIMRMGDYAKAETMFADSLVLKREQNDLVGQGFSEYYLALVNLYQDHLEQAQERLNASAAMWAQVANNERGMAYCTQGWGMLALARKEFPAAQEQFERALASCTKLVLKAETIENLSWLSQAYLGLGRLDEARQAADQANKLLAAQRDVEEEQQIYLNHYRVLLGAGDARASELLQRAVKEMEEQAARLAEPAEREIFLRQVRVNQEIQAAVGNTSGE